MSPNCPFGRPLASRSVGPHRETSLHTIASVAGILSCTPHEKYIAKTLKDNLDPPAVAFAA